MTTCRSDRDGDGDVECPTAGGGPAAASTVERGACPGNRRLVPTFSEIPFAGWTLVAAGVAAYATRIQGSRPASNPGSEGLKIVSRAGVTSRFLLPQDCHHTRPGCERRREGLGHSLARECGRFRKRRCRARRCRLQRSSWNQVNGALRADDIVHATEGMRSSNDPEPERRGRVLRDTMPTRPPDAARTTAAWSRPAGWRKDVGWPPERAIYARSTAGLCPSISALREIAS
jgi:hypothetical protein